MSVKKARQRVACLGKLAHGFSVKKKSRCQCVQEDWDSESDCCMFGVWMFHRRNADRLLEVCALDVSVLHVMGFD